MNYESKLPEIMKRPLKEGGVVERFEYDTNSYDDKNLALHKGAWVYLPVGYCKEKKYNILYLLHGGGVTEDWWFKMFPDTKDIVDNMIDMKLCEGCIIVAPSYYTGEEVDKNAEYITEHFKYELRKDLIPAIETRYSTYAAGDVSEENLIATREHRAFAGLSLGSMTTYRAAIYSNYDLFAWYGPFSGCCGPNGNRDEEVCRIKDALEKGKAGNLPLKYMFCANGDQDIAFEEHIEIMTRVEEECDILKRGKNYDFFIIPGGVHDMDAWQLHLYYALQIFFKIE